MYFVVLIQALLATVGSLYYGRFGDPALNFLSGEFFSRSNGIAPCQLCRFARVLMYPILIIALLGFKKRAFDYVLVMVLSGLGILLEAYQYWFQMTKSDSEIQSVICGVEPGVSCAATDVIYRGFVTIPFLCLVAFIVIFVASLSMYKKKKQ